MTSPGGNRTGHDQGLRVLDRRFARWVRDRCATDEDSGALLESLAAAVSHALHLKHSCLDLERVGELGEPELDRLLDAVDPDTLAAWPENHTAISAGRAGAAPLVRSVDGRRVWLQKYFLFEQTVARRVRALAGEAPEALSDGQREALDRLFPHGDDSGAGQREATILALTRRFSVITGGPGTGKTWTVAGILGLLQLADPDLRIALAAPTGKAANRVMQSLGQAAHNARFEGLLQDHRLPEKAGTLHSLLGVRRHSVKPRHHRREPLHCDVLIVDEASMIDLPMMARVLDALPDHGRLVLLGDKDQLSSVEAGGVLADLCRRGEGSLYRDPAPPVAELTFNYRNRDKPQIQALARAVNRGGWPEVDATNELRVHVLSPGDNNAPDPGWLGPALAHFEALARDAPEGGCPRAVLERLSGFQLLCALREGPAGVTGINARLERALGRAHREATGADPRRGGRAWFPGLPVMVLRNDHERRLFNGDVGLVLPVSEGDGDDWTLAPDRAGHPEDLRACFLVSGNESATEAQGGARLKAIAFSQMPPFESAFALTVHKSQGSEYDHVAFVLPDDAAQVADNPVLTRELLYTGITRARSRLDLWAGAGVPETAAARSTVRLSGLACHAD